VPDEDLNWNLLRMFYVVAQEQSITAASKWLGISQPSVSNALQKLESQLGCQLVYRDSRHFELTLQGEKVYQECSDMFQGADRIARLAHGNLDEEHGEVKIQIISNLVSPFIDEQFRLFHRRHPSVKLHVEVRNSHEILNNIAKGTVGIGICLLNRPVINLESLQLFREDWCLFCGAEHALFGKNSISERELRQEPFIAFTCAVEGMGLEPMAVLQASAKLGSRVTGWSSNLQEIKRMIIAGMGIGILPPAAVEQDIKMGTLWPVKINDRSIGADVYLVHADKKVLSGAEKVFVETIEELRQVYDVSE